MSEPQHVQLHAVVHGRVHGVGFRDATRRRAADLGLTGWVCNRADNTVEVVAEGVETEPQATFLRQQGCQRLQGYYFSAAQPASAHFNSDNSLKDY